MEKRDNTYQNTILDIYTHQKSKKRRKKKRREEKNEIVTLSSSFIYNAMSLVNNYSLTAVNLTHIYTDASGDTD